VSTITSKSREIKAARLRAGLSLRGLAMKTKTHYSTLSNVENGKGCVSPRVARAVSDALNVNFDDLFEIVYDVQKGA
jgi:transcriptional regulator with XRE-family HTH domain